jgi:hypothetical protein
MINVGRLISQVTLLRRETPEARRRRINPMNAVARRVPARTSNGKMRLMISILETTASAAAELRLSTPVKTVNHARYSSGLSKRLCEFIGSPCGVK